MTKHEIAVLSFKILCIYALIRSIDGFYSFLYYLIYKTELDYTNNINLLMTSIPSLLMLLCAVLLWFGSSFLAKAVFKKSPSETEVKSSLTDIQRVAFSVVGLYLLASALPEIVEISVVALTISNTQSGSSFLAHSIITLLFKVAIGLWLLFGSYGFVNFLKYLNGKRSNF